MNQFSLVVVDTTAIQAYIFGSNRLRENVGASHLVHMATRGWLLDEPDRLLPRPHNIRGRQMAPELQIEATAQTGPPLAAEVIQVGGGNAVILFRSESDARTFGRRLSTRLLVEAPGLEAVMVVEPFAWSGSLAAAMSRAYQKLAAKKAQREPSQPLLGLGVSARCRSTGLVANFLEREPGAPDGARTLPISAETRAKWDNNAQARSRLRRSLDVLQDLELDIPDQFEHLGRTAGEFSYIAVVHADGNHVGKTARAITERNHSLTSDDNRRYIEELRVFSAMVDSAGLAALNETVGAVIRWNLDRENGLPPHAEGGREYISIRPIVFGGDDVTFVCDGRIGLRAAQIYLEAFNRQQIPDAGGQNQPAIAAAGVAIVKSGYPFARAYELSEQLCANAKRAVQRKAPALDWHMAQGGLYGSLGEIRAREYGEERNERGEIVSSLLMRPVTVGASTALEWRTWDNFVALQRAFKADWATSKLMNLRESLRQGSSAVQIFTRNYGELPPADLRATQYRKTGWDSGRCVYFDAIEMFEQEVNA